MECIVLYLCIIIIISLDKRQNIKRLSTNIYKRFETVVMSAIIANSSNKITDRKFRPLCNIAEFHKYDPVYFRYISQGEKYSGFLSTNYSDMLAPRSSDEACKEAFIKIVNDTHAKFNDMVAVAHALLERVRPQLETEGGTHSDQDFPINMPVHLNGKDVKIGIRGWNLTSKVTAPDLTTVMFGHNPPLSVDEKPEIFEKLLPKVNGDKRIAELYQAGGSFMLLACGFTQEKTVRGGDNPYYLGPEILKKFGI